MNAHAITKAKATKASAKTIKAFAPEEQEDISPAASEWEDLSSDEELEPPAEEPKLKRKLTEKEKRFARLDELHAGLYEGESDSEWEDADLSDDEEEEEREKIEINELIDEAREVTEQTIKDLDANAIRSLEKNLDNLTQIINQLKDEVDVMKADEDCDEDDLKEKKKELASTRKTLRAAKADIKEKKETGLTDYNEIKIEKAGIEAELARFETMAAYFDTVDALVEYATSNEDQFRSFFSALKCKADLDRSLFFNDTYDVAYDTTFCKVEDEYEKYRQDNDMSDSVASVSQLEWDEIYESLGDEHYSGDIEKLNMKQLKFLCVEFNIPRDGKKPDIVERLKCPHELYVPKNKRTEPFDTFKTGDPNQEKYDELMEEKSYYKNPEAMKILRQRKIMGCQLMKASKGHIKYIFRELGLELPKGKQEDLVKRLLEHYYEIYLLSTIYLP